MKQNNYKPQIPDVLETIFDVAYLIFELIALSCFSPSHREIPYLSFTES